MPRLLLLAPSFALLVALLLAGPALAALRIGTDGSETLVGTTGNDQFNGKGGSDILKGKAGNDVYFFVNNWGGTELLVEKAGEGIDTVNFRGVTNFAVTVRLIPEWIASNFFNNGATNPGGGVLFRYTVNGAVMQSIVENAIGGQADGDTIIGGSGKNILQPGGGATDHLWDYGGYNDGPEGQPNLAASNDVYKGFAGNTGTDFIGDWGGAATFLIYGPSRLGTCISTGSTRTTTSMVAGRRRACRS